MPITLPVPLRVAAGLVGAAIDRLGKLPDELPTLGVTLAGKAVQLSFRVQQEIAGLATRGDELLSGITGRAEEHPAWATFDEDDSSGPPTSKPAAGSSRPSAAGASQPSAAGSSGPKFSVPEPDLSAPATAPRKAPEPRPTAGTAAPKPRPTAGRAAPRTRATAGTSSPEPGTASKPRANRTGVPRSPSVRGIPTGPLAGQPSEAVTAGLNANHSYSVSELKERLLDVDRAEVQRLLTAEENGPNRAPYLTLLGNRLISLQYPGPGGADNSSARGDLDS